MAEFTFVCTVKDIPDGSIKTFILSGKRIALSHIDTDFFAVDDLCTHSECSLGTEGLLDSHTIVCGCHGAAFDVATGKVLSPPAIEALKTYPVAVDGESVSVLLS